MEKQTVTLKDLKAINLGEARHQFVTMPIYWLVVIFVAGWIGKPWLSDAIGFVTPAQAKAQMEELKKEDTAQALAIARLGKKIDDQNVSFQSHVIEFRVTAAFQLQRGYERDLARHNESPMDTRAWREDKREMEGKVALAIKYKACLRLEENNCHLLQRQLLQ